MKKIYLVFFALLSSSFIQGQTIYQPVTPDKYDPDVNEYNVINTGNDIIEGENLAFETHVTVCDGDTPKFIWWDAYTSGNHRTIGIEYDDELNFTIKDPDVVLMESHDNVLGNDYYYTLIVYQTNSGEIYLLVKYYDSYNYPYTWFYSDRIFIGYGSNPNIDATTNEQSNNNGDDNFVITWEDDGYIKAYAANFINGQIQNGSGEVIIYDPNDHGYEDAATPDVTISYTALSPLYAVSFTFVADEQLWIDQEDFDDIMNNNISNPNLDFVFDLSTTTNYGRPRIASPDIEHGGLAYNAWDAEIVIDADPDQPYNNTMIWGFNRYAGTQTNHNYEYTSDPNWTESLPVICYSGDMIFVSWVLVNIGSGTYEDVIQIACDNQGTFGNGYYSRVNYDSAGIQSIPSISAFYYTGNVYYSFMDFEDDHIKSKISLESNYQLKKITEYASDIFPNPAHEKFVINANSKCSIRLSDMGGKLLMNSEIEEGMNEMDIQGLTPGIYYLQFLKENGFETKKLVVY